MVNIRFIIFVGITIMIIGILAVLIIPVAYLTNGGIAAIISTTLFVIYLFVIDNYVDGKLFFRGKQDRKFKFEKIIKIDNREGREG